MRIDVLVDDGPQGAAEFGVFWGELHEVSPTSSERGPPGPHNDHERTWRSALRRDSSVAQARQCAHQLGNDLQHHLVGAAADRAETAVAVAPRYRTVPQIAGAAPVLQAGIGDLPAPAAGLELGHRGPHR